MVAISGQWDGCCEVTWPHGWQGVQGPHEEQMHQLGDVAAGADVPDHISGWMLWIPLALRMQALVNGMDAVNHKQLRNLTACSGDTILLSTWMDDVNSTNRKDASHCQWNGCCKLQAISDFKCPLCWPNVRELTAHILLTRASIH